ncbi:hypothetical protein GF412_02400 [Candidatus Micrarchaeota archaeon]|nr:hypothetical protein [Candidatus Micrarchaeota archaeon]MBD3417810.1 hypothetical protein [Candidatus Micrarchaeota archaeon]
MEKIEYSVRPLEAPSWLGPLFLFEAILFLSGVALLLFPDIAILGIVLIVFSGAAFIIVGLTLGLGSLVDEYQYTINRFH